MQTRFTQGMESLAERIYWARKRAKLRQQDLAKAAGLNQTDISKLEKGESKTTRGMVAMAKALGCDPHWLATGEGSPDPVGPTYLELTHSQLQAVLFEALTTVKKLAQILERLQPSHTVTSPSSPDTVRTAPPEPGAAVLQTNTKEQGSGQGDAASETPREQQGN